MQNPRKLHLWPLQAPAPTACLRMRNPKAAAESRKQEVEDGISSIHRFRINLLSEPLNLHLPPHRSSLLGLLHAVNLLPLIAKGSTLASTSEASATSHAAPMASTTQNHPYIFQRASTMATRSLLSNANPSQLPPASSDSSAPSTLPSTSTKHYEQAAAEATRAGHIPATTAASAVASVTDRPGTMRQPSWKMSDLKGQQQSQLVSNAPGGHGYSTTQAQ